MGCFPTCFNFRFSSATFYIQSTNAKRRLDVALHITNRLITGFETFKILILCGIAPPYIIQEVVVSC